MIPFFLPSNCTANVQLRVVCIVYGDSSRGAMEKGTYVSHEAIMNI